MPKTKEAPITMLEHAPLGAQLKCKISGFTGTCTMHITVLTGCNQVQIQARAVDGKAGVADTFDITVIERANGKMVTGAQPKGEQRVALGSNVESKISGLHGIVIGYCQQFSGSDRYIVQCPAKKNKSRGKFMADCGELNILKEGAVQIEPKEVASARPGAPAEHFSDML